MSQTATKSARKLSSVSGFTPAQGDPEDWAPVDPLNGVLSLSLRPGPEDKVGPGQSHVPRLDELLSTSRQLSSKPLGDRSGLSSQPFWHGVRGRSGRSMFKVQWNLSGPRLPSPYPPPLPSLPFGVFLNVRCFRHSWEPFSSLLISWCVLGRLCRSWEHRRFLLFFSLLSPPLPIWLPVFYRVSPSHTFFLLFSFMSPCFHVFSSHPFFRCVHTCPGLSVL